MMELVCHVLQEGNGHSLQESAYYSFGAAIVRLDRMHEFDLFDLFF